MTLFDPYSNGVSGFGGNRWLHYNSRIAQGFWCRQKAVLAFLVWRPPCPARSRSGSPRLSDGNPVDPATAPADMASSWLEAIVESTDDAIIGKNLNGIVTSWNNAA